MKRHNFASRRGPTVAKIREKHKYDHIYACDETAVWLDASGGKTVEERGDEESEFFFDFTSKLMIFTVCGLTNASDGSEDNFIHCFKAHGAIPEGLEMLKKERAIKSAAEMSEKEDVEDDPANGYLSAEDDVIENEDFFVT
uniref:Transposase n=1 Tax=Ditylenchus dipsaci TaxID=166011 RepID=A0A915CZ06_9BILA